jgi:hypothetical protein
VSNSVYSRGDEFVFAEECHAISHSFHARFSLSVGGVCESVCFTV